LEEIKFKNNNVAYKHLTEIVKQLYTAYKSIVGTLDDFISLSFDTKKAILSSEEFLFRAKSGYISDYVKASRYHCGRIREVYDRYLKDWFSSIVSIDMFGNWRRLKIFCVNHLISYIGFLKLISPSWLH
jgi:hypothetical protein